MQFRLINAKNGVAQMITRMEDEDNGSELPQALFDRANMLSFVMTTASHSDWIGDVNFNEIDSVRITDSLQEVVNRPGFSSGNAVVVRVDGPNTPNVYEMTGSEWQLNIQYTN